MRTRLVRTPTETFDDPWKRIVRELFPQFIEFFFPAIADDIDWSRPVEFLDTELRRIARGLRGGRMTADFLVKVTRKNGEKRLIIAHIELQAQKDIGFPRRMFLYNVRAYDHYDEQVVSLAILADRDSSWRPDQFTYGLWGSETGIRYPVVKLLDYAERLTELEASDNPFGLACYAYLKTLETHGDADQRYAWKVRLVRMLSSRGWQRNQYEELFHFIDWIMGLPPSMEKKFSEVVEEIERDPNMPNKAAPIILMAEGRGEVRGEVRGIRRAVVRQMRRKFGALPASVSERIEQITDTDHLDELLDAVLTANTLAEMPLTNRRPV